MGRRAQPTKPSRPGGHWGSFLQQSGSLNSFTPLLGSPGGALPLPVSPLLAWVLLQGSSTSLASISSPSALGGCLI